MRFVQSLADLLGQCMEGSLCTLNSVVYGVCSRQRADLWLRGLLPHM